jgi:hypothetical protein
MAGSPGSAAGTRDSAASTRADALAKDASWDFLAASQTGNITKSLYPEEMRRVTPFGNETFGGDSAHVSAWFMWKSGMPMWGQPPLRQAQGRHRLSVERSSTLF